jgi:pumilio family protein 6
MSCFDCVDDTILLSKSIINELFNPANKEESVADLLCDKVGSKVVLYLLCGRDKRYQANSLIQELEAMDAVRATTTKKEDGLRREQLLEAVSEPLTQAILENMTILSRSKCGTEVVNAAICNLKTGSDIIAKLIQELESNVSTENLEKQQPEGEFNAVKKLRAEAISGQQLAEGIDVTESLMLNRSSTRLFKQLTKKQEGEQHAWHDTLISELWRVLKESFTEWLEYCAKNTTSAAAQVLLSVWLNAPESIQASMKKLYAKKPVKVSSSNEAVPANSNKRKHEDSKPAIQLLLSNLQ